MFSDFFKRLGRYIRWGHGSPKSPDLSAVADFGRKVPVIRSSLMGQFGPAFSCVGDPKLTLAPINFEKDWAALSPESAWRILQNRRAIELFPHQPCEFDVYMDLLRRSGAQYQSQLFIGVRAGDKPEPILIPRYVCARHSLILGGTGRAKTAHAVAQLLWQFSSHYVDEYGQREDSPPIMIMDMKFNGDKYLRSVAERIAANRGQKLRFFSNNPAFTSLKFDPMFCFRSVKYPLKLAETLMKAFSVVYPEGYGPTFFSNEQRQVFLNILKQERPDSFDRLIELVRKATYGKNGNKDARGLYAALAALKVAEHAHTDNTPLSDDERIDFDRFFDKREVLYIHLDTRGLPMASKDIGRLILYALAETAAQREQQGRKIQAFIVLDEFQRLAAKNLVEMAEDARQSGLAFIFSLQTAKSLLTNDNEDLFGILFGNCGFIQLLSLNDDRAVELLRMISGSKIEIRRSHSVSVARSSSGSVGGSSGAVSDAYGICTTSFGSNYSSGSGTTVTESNGEREEKVPGLTPEMIVDVHAHTIRSIVQVNAADEDEVTPLGGKPVLVQGLFPFSSDEAKAMAKQTWPRNPERDDDYYYPKVRAERPLVPGPPQPSARGDELAARKELMLPFAAAESSVPSSPKTTASAPPPDAAQPKNAAEFRERIARLKRVCERLAQHMLQTKLPG